MDPEFYELKVTVATLVERINHLVKTVEAQERTVEELVALANKGKGSAWVLMGFGGIAGFILSNAKSILQFFLR